VAFVINTDSSLTQGTDIKRKGLSLKQEADLNNI